MQRPPMIESGGIHLARLTRFSLRLFSAGLSLTIKKPRNFGAYDRFFALLSSGLYRRSRSFTGSAFARGLYRRSGIGSRLTLPRSIQFSLTSILRLTVVSVNTGGNFSSGYVPDQPRTSISMLLMTVVVSISGRISSDSAAIRPKTE